MDATRWIGAVIGFSATGYAVDRLGLQTALFTSALLPLLAMLLLAAQQAAKMKTYTFNSG